MSDAQTRIPLAHARTLAADVMERLGMVSPECAIVGSVRREKPDVGDIELIAPLPQTEMDWLYQQIGAAFTTPEDAGSMFPRENTIGSVVKGWKPGFLYCQLLANAHLPVKVDIFRYTHGQTSNRGWIELMRTGPADFSEMILTKWKHKCGTAGSPKPGSEKGFLVDSMGTRRHTPTEQDVFALVGMEFVPPAQRGTP